ncbi:MAG: manganese/iron transport system substrate-binding protein [Actinomycetota bacterium]|nr:manganese/iron transport system substrate-binding protein [Actinomycetota bacterium]
MSGRWSRSALSLVALGLLLASGCAGAGVGSSGRLRVVATVSPITNIVHNIGGDKIDLTGLVPEGTNSHTFEPAPSDAKVLAEADVVFLNGLHLEEPTRALAEGAISEGTPLVELGEMTISPDSYIYDFSFPMEAGDPNPHLWTNPLYGKAYAREVRDELSRLEPADKSYFAANYRDFATRVDSLDAAVRRASASLSSGERKLLTYHDSFPYFAREYSWDVIGAVQPADFSEPTPREVADLIGQIEDEKVPAVFGSEEFPSPVLEQIAAETGARYVDALRDDDLPGEPGDAEHSYLSLLVSDFSTIVDSLGGDASDLAGVDASNLTGDGAVDYR